MDEEEHLLSDGRRVTVRMIRPEDAGALRAAFDRLSPETRYRRFLSGMPKLSDAQLRYLTNVDGENHVALVAIWQTPDLKEERGVGVARFMRLQSDRTVAEAAIVVADEMRRCGLGRILLTELTRIARAKGVRKFCGDIDDANEPVRHILEAIGASLVPVGNGTTSFEVDLGPQFRILPGSAT
jgi:GNAT superfamily N-acetyltransferase